MATEALVWPGPPSLTNGNDDTDYTLGVRFSLVAPQDCSGIVWERTPDVVSHTPTGGQWVATLWNWDSQTILAAIAFTPIAGVRQEVPFVAPVALTTGINYAATVFTRDYVFLTGGGGDLFTPSLNAAADVGVIGVNPSPLSFPASLPSSWYFIGPAMVTGGADPAEGAAGVDLNLAVAASGAAAHRGAANVGLALAVNAAGAAASRGVVALDFALAVAATGARASTGSADAGLGLAVAATGARPAGSAVALGLNLAVNATGPTPEVAPGGPPRLIRTGRTDRLTSRAATGVITSSSRG